MLPHRSSRARRDQVILKFFLLKELKKYPFFFLLLFFTLFLGTMGLVGIGLITGQVQTKLSDNAHELLTSDIAVSARRELFPAEQEALSKVFADEKHERYKIIDIYSMVSWNEKSRLVEVRATERNFPFYGKLTVESGTFSPSELFVSKDLAELWGIKAGDDLKVGAVTMKVSGVVTDDSSLGLRGFSLAPRIYFPLPRLRDTNLLQPGATGSFAYHFLLKDKERVEAIKKEIYASIKDSAVKITLPEDSSDQTGRAINTLTNYMALAALIGLILSLVGVFYLYQSHLVARLKDLCLLNLHGLQKREIISGIVLQFSVVFFAVITAEVLVIGPVYQWLAPSLSSLLSIELPGTIELSTLLFEVPFLYGLSLLILVPLLLGLLRTSMGLQLKASKMALGHFRFYDFIPFLILLWLFSSYLGKSFKTGNIFFASLMMVFLFSTVIVRTIQWAIGKVIRGKGLLLPTIENGIALRSLSRSGHKLTLSFLSLAMGATLISLILQLDKMIMNEFALDTKKPALFLFDVQEEQIDQLKEFSVQNGTPLAFVTPMIRARLEKVNGKKFVRQKKDFDFRSREEDEDARFRNNGLNLTYRDYLTDAEKIIEGEPFPREHDENRDPYISIEKRWSQRMGIKLGDKLTFDIQGVELDGVVRNIKEVKWTSFYPNFFVTLEPGAIEAAPKTYLAILPATQKEKKIAYQRKAVEHFPNVSFIDVEELIRKLTLLFERSREAIELISWLSLAVGLVILYGLSHDQVYRRYYDIALMKSLGLSSGALRLNLLYEFGSLFLSAVTLGLFLGWLIAQVIGREVFKVSTTIDWERIFYPALLLSILCLATILISSWRAVDAKPRELLSDA